MIADQTSMTLIQVKFLSCMKSFGVTCVAEICRQWRNIGPRRSRQMYVNDPAFSRDQHHHHVDSANQVRDRQPRRNQPERRTWRASNMRAIPVSEPFHGKSWKAIDPKVLIDEGKLLIQSLACTDCHPFFGQRHLSPELTKS
jgi:hypothetical protein